MPEEHYYKDDHGEEMSCLEELIAHSSTVCQSLLVTTAGQVGLPHYTMRREREPSLEEKCNDTCPIEQRAHHCNFHHHIMEANVINDEWKGVHQCKQKERIRSPSMYYLQFLVGHSGKECDPIRLTCCRTAKN